MVEGVQQGLVLVGSFFMAHPTLVSTSLHRVLNLVPFMGPLLVSSLFQCLAIPC